MNLEEKFLNSAAASLPTGELEGVVEIGELTRDPEQFSATATKREGGVGFADGVAPNPVSSSSTTQPVTAPAVGAANRVFPEDTASIQNIPRNTLQEIMGTIGSAIQSGAEVIDFDVIGLPDVGTLTLKDLTVGDLGKVMEAMSYGFAPTTGAGETLRPTPEALDLLNAIPAFKAASSVLKYGARELAPAAANMIEEGLRKSGMIMDIVPDGKSVAQQATKSDIGFYSAVENAAINVQRKSGAGQSFLNDIMKGENVKAEEIKWMGLDEFLKGKKNVTKQEVQDYIANNKVDVQEVALGEQTGSINKNSKYATPEVIRIVTQNQGSADNAALMALDNDFNAYKEITSKFPELKDNPDWAETVLNDVTGTFGNIAGLPKFSQYTLAGGENYRELLLTMPDKKIMPDVLNEQYSFNTLPDGRVQLLDEGKLVSTSKDMDGAWSEAKAVGAIDYGKDKAVKFQSSHFDQPNILAHLRVNDRVDADGKKMLLIEEVQSDWHQAGRDKGYTTTAAKDIEKQFKDYSKELAAKYDLNPEQNLAMYATMKRMQPEEVSKYEQLQSASVSVKGGVPDAPFKDTWYQLALKRALQHAAENGYERVGLTTGKQQVDRFDLSKQVDELLHSKNPDGTYQVSAQIHGRGQMLGDAIPENKLADYVGKDVAEKIIKGEGKRTEVQGKTREKEYMNSLSGIDLRIGGEGMKKYYDEIYPKFLEKYGRKWGAKVGETKIRTQSDKQAQEDLDLLEQLGEDRTKFSGSGMAKVRYIDITPEMKAGVQKGQPLFAAAPIGAATGTAAMQDERKK